MKAEVERAKEYESKLREEFADQTAEYLSAATVKAVSEAYASEDTPSVDWYKEQLENEELLESIKS